jgi:AraC-like DNA-binding protein
LHQRLPILIAAGLSQHGRIELTRTLADTAIVHFASYGSDRASRPIDLRADGFVLELPPTDIAAMLTFIRHRRREQPLAPVIVCCGLYQGVAHHLHDAVRAGATMLALHGYDRIADVVRNAFADWQFAAICRATLDDILPRLPQRSRPVMEYCVANVRHAISVIDVANALSVHPRSLHRLLRGCGLPAPASVISWSRLFVAVRLMAEHALPVERVALMVGFTTGSGLRNMLKHYSGRRPTEIRQPGALGAMVDQFMAYDDRLIQLRDSGVQRGASRVFGGENPDGIAMLNEASRLL